MSTETIIKYHYLNIIYKYIVFRDVHAISRVHHLFHFLHLSLRFIYLIFYIPILNSLTLIQL